jgi:putative heme-binding domain-containing protein
MAGHNGFPDKPDHRKNSVRLRSSDTQSVLAEAFPPRTDLAQPYSWELSAHAGKQGYLEVVDGDAGESYAWLAVGRFNPPVVPLPAINPSQIAQRQQAAAELARTLPLPKLEPQLAELLMNPATELDTSAVVARALVALNPEDNLAALASVVGDPSLPGVFRQRISQAVAHRRTADGQTILVEVLRACPRRLQVKLAQTLASNAAGGEKLIKLVADGHASASLLLERSVKDKLLAAESSPVQERLDQLTKGLMPPNQNVQWFIRHKLVSYDAAKAEPVRGEQVFTQNCRICHQIDGIGTVVGPQLDGIGNRGLERLLEDVLDPNRNVDRAFRNTILVMKDGEIVSGLFRRDEGEMAVLAESTGKEISIPRKQIQERRESETSLMPENFGDVLPPEDLNHLMAYLLSKRSKQTAAAP